MQHFSRIIYLICKEPNFINLEYIFYFIYIKIIPNLILFVETLFSIYYVILMHAIPVV